MNCKKCNKHCKPAEMIHIEGYGSICKDCYERGHYFTCDHCRLVYRMDDYADGHAGICKYCYKKAEMRCHNCGRAIWHPFYEVDMHGFQICESCAENDYFICEECGELAPVWSATDTGEKIFCPECASTLRGKKLRKQHMNLNERFQNRVRVCCRERLYNDTETHKLMNIFSELIKESAKCKTHSADILNDIARITECAKSGDVQEYWMGFYENGVHSNMQIQSVLESPSMYGFPYFSIMRIKFDRKKTLMFTNVSLECMYIQPEIQKFERVPMEDKAGLYEKDCMENMWYAEDVQCDGREILRIYHADGQHYVEWDKTHHRWT